MSGEIVLEFLVTRFSSALEDVKKHHHQVPLRNSFEQMEPLLRQMISPSMPDSRRDDLKKILHELNDAFAECQVLYEKKRRRTLPHYTIMEAYTLYKIQRDLSRSKQKLQTRNEAIKSLPTVDHESQGAEDISEVEKPRIYGFDIIGEEMISSLRQECDNGIHPIGIVGMGGSGKTTLAQLVYHDERVKMEFSPRIWVSVSSKADTNSECTKNIVECLLKELGDDEDDDDDDDGETREYHEQVTEEENEILNKLLATLYKQLDGKKFLIVFDDVWQIDRWYGQLVNSPPMDHLGLPKGYGGGIIISSRLQKDVEQKIAKANLHHTPSALADEHCWSIFKDVLQKKRIDMAYHPFLIEMQAEIVENCNGLPLAAKTLGEIFSKKILEEELTWH